MDLRPKFNELEDLLLNQRDLIGLHSGVPFVLLVYPPEQERICQGYQENLAEKLRARGVPVLNCELRTFIFDHYEEQGHLEKIFDLDKDPNERDRLRRMVAGVYEKKLVGWVLEKAKTAEPNGVVFLTGVPSLYPFARVSNLLTDLENKVKIPLVVFYPGRERDGSLYFLDSNEAHTGYRARII